MSSSCRYDLIVCIVAIHSHRAYCWQSHQNSRAFDFSVPSRFNRNGHERPAQHDARGNLIYLALITERMPIISKFLSNHIDPSTPPFVFGEVFDVPRLIEDPESQVLDDLGCWTIWETVQQHIEIPEPRRSPLMNMLKHDVSWMRTPAWVDLTPPSVYHNHASFWSLASLGFAETRSKSLGLSLTNRHSPQHQVSLPPDDHIYFFYYISAHHTWDCQHMRWTASMENIVDAHARRAMNEPTPPQCEEFSVDQCFAPLSVIARRLSEVQEELRTQKGIEATHVIMTSDEMDPEWWSDVGALGWTWVDYAAERTEDIYGKCSGFIGTRGSTMSTLAGPRVQS
ncbi:uncharacterized protein F5891DRAFT_1130051 [Suillus fuscotomentosus]|uniref:Uncharacterized protein n=1 Tax=Suillus fuscotomentosus TaxID=1912939 RepID=A0AAD4DZQ4_9AGAM|nr:uncharacterized protein F5891DRAFT_1130051 [Suillus fuscotomentosus]KAG1896947.1 hypothetical protein F5891DRAFT_1130051 [Suillus fuscotomentosus]